MGAPTNSAYVKKVLANSEPSTHGGEADMRRPPAPHSRASPSHLNPEPTSRLKTKALGVRRPGEPRGSDCWKVPKVNEPQRPSTDRNAPVIHENDLINS